MPFLPCQGVRLAYREHGSGEPLLLIHGSGAQAATWDGVTGGLAAAGHRVIGYDRRGYGDSAHPPVRDHRRHVRDAVAVLERVAKAPATVAGWSAGANIALALTAERPDLVRRLIVVEPPLHGLRHATPSMLGTLARAKWAQLRGRRREAAAFFFRWAAGDAFDAAPHDERERLLAHARNVLAELDPHPYGVMFEHLPLSRVRSIQVPVTFLIGEKSNPFFHTVHRELMRALPSMRSEVIPGATHLVHIDAPDAFVAAVRRAAAPGPAAPGPAVRGEAVREDAAPSSDPTDTTDQQRKAT
ncbi:alpha/beta fold hydrolase [Streptomyces jumonjinensis]|uniref:Alpha/beta hydrolase n=1 Tax=Streptomyces jumonjinensis TaxID=1945 RepID=A0A646KNW1_STRJU|nr:alpha/beta hydrolase [Streptomyces jumonjinensis]MQT03790.1 alpha/beta hydrolase [Streptomyces jumonjinensis]